MYEEAEMELKRILQLAETCPESLREKAFEILLQGYVSSLTIAPQTPGERQERPPVPSAPPPPDDTWRIGIPQEVLPRFQAMASRIKVKPAQLASVFDFSVDPFTYAPMHVEGKTNRQRLFRVAMFVAARSFLATGKWLADWAEIKAMSTHQNCYDVNNFASNLSSAEGDWFNKVNSGTNVQISGKGQKEAESMLARLAAGSDATEE